MVRFNNGERRTRPAQTRQLIAIAPLVTVWGIGALVLALTLDGDAANNALLLLDSSAVAGLPWYSGLISNLGILAWAIGTISAAGASFIARLGRRDGAAKFLLHASALSALLTLDDVFRLHSSVFPQHLSIPKTAVLVIYLVMTALWAGLHCREVARTRWAILVASGIAMATSVGVDQLAGNETWSLVAEDGAKFFGVLGWATYFWLTAQDIASSVVRDLRERASMSEELSAILRTEHTIELRNEN